MLKIKPNPNKQIEGKPIQVFDPVRKDFLPAEGRDVPRSEYWTRRLADGSAIKVEPVAKKKTHVKAKQNTNSKTQKKQETITKASSEGADETAAEYIDNDKKED